jgi:hypothetical protein
MLKIDEQEYERVKEFKLRGAFLTQDNDISADIKRSIIMANELAMGSGNS